ncbi:MAG: hypothetical protein DBP01_00210, partial [gamma proteobacterium symbiont of Ctena orbiculata]
DFSFWIERLRAQSTLFDFLRIDHFRGFEAYWEIPAEEKTAVNGRWVEAPGNHPGMTILEQIKELAMGPHFSTIMSHEDGQIAK